LRYAREALKSQLITDDQKPETITDNRDKAEKSWKKKSTFTSDKWKDRKDKIAQKRTAMRSNETRGTYWQDGAKQICQ
jgi:hypothetical protein